MANMNFGVNILPKANNTYTLGNSDYKWNIFANTLNGVSLTNIITDIQIDGTSIVNNSIATIPIAGALTLGLVKLDSGYGISANASGRLYLIKANSTRIKEGTSSYFPITPYNQHESVFYGLAKVAGDSTQSASSNAVGTYTDGAKTAIQSMLGITTMTGATSSVAGTAGLVPAPATTDVDKFLAGDGTYKSGGLPMVILSYGSSTWQDFINAYNNNVIVYCRASSNSNPGTGSQTRMAFMAYVNDASSPTNVEFQYYRSMSSHSATAMGDEVYVYKLTNASGGTWSVTTRKASIKEIDVASGSKLSVSWSSDKVTLSNTMTADDMPMSSSDATTAKSAIDAINTTLGSTTMGTTATTITGAIAEHESDISTLNSKIDNYAFVAPFNLTTSNQNNYTTPMITTVFDQVNNMGWCTFIVAGKVSTSHLDQILIGKSDYAIRSNESGIWSSWVKVINSKIGNEELEEMGNTNIGTDGVGSWVDVKYINVQAGTYFVQYSQFGVQNAMFIIAISANNKTYAIQTNDSNSMYNSISISSIVKMASAGTITLKIYSLAQMSNKERHIECYRII